MRPPRLTPRPDFNPGPSAPRPVSGTQSLRLRARWAFCDVRRFGSIFLADSPSAFDELAPDAFLELPGEEEWVTALAQQRTGIKALLLNQKKIVSGIGNWIADEVCGEQGDVSHGTSPGRVTPPIHPDLLSRFFIRRGFTLTARPATFQGKRPFV